MRVAALALLVVALSSSPASAGPLAPTRASQVVVLHPSTVSDSPCGVTAYPVDGMRKSNGLVEPFVIPPKQVFVVTSADVYGSAEPSRHYRFVLVIDSSDPIPGGALLIGEAETDAAGYYAGSVSVPSGVVVPPGALLCAQIDGPTEEPTIMRVHGFFAKDK